MTCPFCDPDERKNRTLEDAPDHYVMLSNPRLMAGHTLVIPKRHLLRPSELTADERKNIFDTVLRWQDKITSAFSVGCDIRENYRPFRKESKTKIDHIHFHLQPRLPDDAYSRVDDTARSFFEDLGEEERERITAIYSK